jgi:hypothetical protein
MGPSQNKFEAKKFFFISFSELNNEDTWLQQMKGQEYDQASIFGYKREKKCKAKSILMVKPEGYQETKFWL